jgi:hypothetical protein
MEWSVRIMDAPTSKAPKSVSKEIVVAIKEAPMVAVVLVVVDQLKKKVVGSERRRDREASAR